MSQPVSVLPSGVLGNDGSPASSRISSNTRVRGAADSLGTQADVMQFAGPSLTGSWILGASRVQVNGIPVIHQSSSGTCVGTPGTLPPGPMSLVLCDPRIQAQ